MSVGKAYGSIIKTIFACLNLFQKCTFSIKFLIIILVIIFVFVSARCERSEQHAAPHQADADVQQSAQGGQSEHHGADESPQLQERVHLPQGQAAES